MKVNVVARDLNSAEKFLARHESIKDFINVVHGTTSLFTTIRDLVDYGDDIEVFCHDDVFLPTDFLSSVANWCQSAEEEWPNWGIAGNAGVPAVPVGLGAHEIVRHLADPHGGPTGLTETVPGQSIDGNLILLNCKRLRERGFSLPHFEGFHLYDLAVSIEAQVAGLAVLICPALYCYHDSKGSQFGFNKVMRSEAVQEYLRLKVRNRSILTVNGIVEIPNHEGETRLPSAIDLPLVAITNAAVGRPTPSLEIVTRSTLSRPGLLERCCISIDIARSFSGEKIDHVVVTGQSGEGDQIFGRSLRRLKTDSSDDRFELLVKASLDSTADYVWFVDDDDWVLPNRIREVLDCMRVFPQHSLFVGQAAHFKEQIDGKSATYQFSPTEVLRVFEPSEVSRSFSGINFEPINACIFPVSVIRSLPPEIYRRIIYYEDLAMMLFALTHLQGTVVILPWLISGISIRGDGQSVGEQDRDKWNSSMAEFRDLFLRDRELSRFVDVIQSTSFTGPGGRLLRDQSLVVHFEHQRDEAIKQLEELASHWTWRLTRPFRILRRFRRANH